MNEKTISVEALCGQNIYTRADGRVLYDAITSSLGEVDKVIVDFGGKAIASESFMDEAIVEHYLHPIGSRDPAAWIVLRGVAKFDRALLDKIFAYRKKLQEKLARRERSASS